MADPFGSPWEVRGPSSASMKPQIARSQVQRCWVIRKGWGRVAVLCGSPYMPDCVRPSHTLRVGYRITDQRARLWLCCCFLSGLSLIAVSACDAAAGTSPAGVGARGGVLRVVDPPGYPQEPRPNAITLDPQNFTYDSAELYRCCVGRTLLSYNGQPTSSGGADLRPDLAVAMPDVSADGLTWTFHIKAGLHYAPPEQNAEIVAGDFIRALARTARLPNAAPVSYSMIRGYDAFAARMTSSIAGLESPDAHTLVVRLTQPEGDLGNRLSLPSTAPTHRCAVMPGRQAAFTQAATRALAASSCRRVHT